jgi:hypothetical protein
VSGLRLRSGVLLGAAALVAALGAAAGQEPVRRDFGHLARQRLINND